MLGIDRVSVHFGETRAVDDLSLVVDDGERVAVLGPSGSGKSTLLRAVAGLEHLDSGTVSWDGRDLAATPPHRRRFGFMFQGYALFPHLDVADNVGFGLKMEGNDPADIGSRVAEVLEWVGLSGFGRRSVERLSGGEQQRVALARTLAPRPRLVMLDEPLGSLDRALRDRLITEITELLESTGVAALYVTHDHDEASTFADRVALMRDGRLVQVGPMEVLRSNPADDWAEEFLD